MFFADGPITTTPLFRHLEKNCVNQCRDHRYGYICNGAFYMGLATIVNNVITLLFPEHPNYIYPTNITLYSIREVMLLEKNSPFVDTMIEVISRALEFGLKRKMYQQHSRRHYGRVKFDEFDWLCPYA